MLEHPTLNSLSASSINSLEAPSTFAPEGLSRLFIYGLMVSISSSTLLTIFGGRVRDLETILIEERIPDGWESRIRERMGLTMATFNRTVLRVELGTDEKKVPKPASARE